jgi:type IV fimbrial biogenesis protein FimT
MLAMSRHTRTAAETPRRWRGLTLIELMIALAVLATLASLAVPEFGRQVSRWKLQAAAERLAADIQEARFEAASRGRPQHLDVHAGAQWCWSVSEVPDCSCESARYCQRERVQAPRSGGVQIERDVQLVISPLADLLPTGDAVRLTNPQGDRLHVLLGPTGRPRICSPDGTRMGYGDC